MPMATKLGRMITYLEQNLPIKSQDHIIMLSCKIMRETKIITLTQCQSLSILSEWEHTMTSSLPYSLIK